MIAAPPLHQTGPSGARTAAPPGRAGNFDEPLDVQRETELNEKRDMAMFQPLVWQGKTLEAWSLCRLALHRRFMMSLMPVPGHLWGQVTEAHAPDAMLFLWLAHHPMETIVSLAGHPVALWVRVFEWAERMIPKSQWDEALGLMLKTFELGKITEVKVRQEASRSGLGEPVPCPREKSRSSRSSAPKGTARRKKSAGGPRCRS